MYTKIQIGCENGGVFVLKIAVVNRNQQESAQLKVLLTEYQERENQPLQIVCYPSGYAFMAEFRPIFDVAFLDIDDKMDGFDAAKEAFTRDHSLCIIFTAELAQYAIRGYEVNALDYILKPFTYPVIADKMEKALGRVRNRAEVVLTWENGALRLPVEDILYIEIINHELTYYTIGGSYSVRGKMKETEDNLKGYGFSRCSNSYLVNLLHVQQIENDVVLVGNNRLPVSRGRKKTFLEDFLSYLGGRNL